MVKLAVLLLLLNFALIYALDRDDILLPYGPSHGDQSYTFNAAHTDDDLRIPVKLAQPFKFWDKDFTDLYVS